MLYIEGHAAIIPISFSIRDMSCNACNRYWGSSIVDTMVLLINMMHVPLSRIFNVILSYTIYSNTHGQSNFTPIHDIIELCLYKLREVSIEHMRWTWQRNLERLLLWHLVSSNFWLAYTLFVETNLFFSKIFCFCFTRWRTVDYDIYLWHGAPSCMSIFFFSPPACLSAVTMTYMTVIASTVT